MSVLAMIGGWSVVEADLAAGRLCCPGCDGPLAPWGYARGNARCGCSTGAIPAAAAGVVPAVRSERIGVAAGVAGARRRDGLEVIGEALLAKANGDGHRRIAARLGRPPANVRWLAARVRAPRRAGRRQRQALDARDRLTRPGSRPAGRVAAVDALDGLGNAARQRPGCGSGSAPRRGQPGGGAGLAPRSPALSPGFCPGG